MKASLFVSTFEMPVHLELVCAGLERQTCRDFEVLFCDDGSGPDTAKVIENFSSRSRIKAHHIWQEHQGFRKCRILNRGVQKSQGEVLVFLDGDCIPHRDFVKDHLDSQEEGYYLAGRRVELGRSLSSGLTPATVLAGYFDWPRLSILWSALKKDSQFFNRSIRIPSKRIRSFVGMDRIVDLKGCNYSIPRKALMAINGFDESYEGYGREDTDVEVRLQNFGLRIKSLKGLALQYHVWHPRREFTSENEDRLGELKNTRRVQCKNGIEKI